MRGATLLRLNCFKIHLNFNPHSPCGERRQLQLEDVPDSEISIHTPHAGSDAIFDAFRRAAHISIHTPHAGSDVSPRQSFPDFLRFQSTLPMRERRTRAGLYWRWMDFNPHSPCGSDVGNEQSRQRLPISIHTPHAGATAKVTEFTLNLKTKFMTFGTKTNCETLQSSVSRICSNEKNYISQVRISKQFMIASHSHIYKISGSSGIYDALFPKCSTFF